MRNVIYSIEELKAIVAPIAEQYELARVYLFGSYRSWRRYMVTAERLKDFCSQILGPNASPV